MTRSFADLHRPGVLVVDDEQAVRTLLATILPLYDGLRYFASFHYSFAY